MMKIALMSGALLLATGTAEAADAVLAPSGPAWQGVYLGGHVGLGMQRIREGVIENTYTHDAGGAGIGGGAFIGYNWLVAPRWVVGLEAEANYGGISSQWYTDDTEYLWSVAARLRAGHLVNPHALVYGSVGWSMAAWDAEYVSQVDDDGYRPQGVQFGYGIESFATDRLSLRLESTLTYFERQEFFNPDVFNLTVEAQTLVVRFGAAYHFGEPAAVKEPTPAFDWSGAYAGVHAGATNLSFVESSDTSGYRTDVGGDGFLGGAFIGMNWEAMPLVVLGVEAEGNLGQVRGNWYAGVNLPETRHDWNAAARFRAGYLFNPATMLYASAGFAFGELELSQSFFSDVTTRSAMVSGAQLGLGLETRMSEHVSVRAEGIYTFFGQETFTFTGGDTNIDLDTLTGRMGVAFHF